jgi:hypothetical protein
MQEALFPPSPPSPLAVGGGGGGGTTTTAKNCGSDGPYPDASILPTSNLLVHFKEVLNPTPLLQKWPHLY